MSDPAPSARLNALTLERNIPVSATIELTRRCPLSCAHCYLPETRGRARPGRELAAPEWEEILRRLAAAGGLYLVFTGGEPLLRPDLERLCGSAKKLNFDVRVFSTGLGLDRARALALKEAGVSGFELSFYGIGAAHDRVTGLQGAFAGTLAAARLLKQAGLAVKMKTPLMKGTLGQAGRLRALARREGFGISFDPVVTAANDGDRSALALRLGRAGLARAARLAPPPAKAGPAGPAGPAADLLCGAGRNVCAVGPDGTLYPCLQLPVPLGNILRSGFERLWTGSRWLKRWRSAGEKDLKGCAGCLDAAFCSRCPGVSLVEEGDAFAPNGPACALAGILSRNSLINNNK